MRLEIRRRELRFRAPMVTAFATLERRELTEVRLSTRDGLVGLGEAAPLEPYHGVSLDAAVEQIESCRATLVEADGRPRAEVLAACAERAPLPHALAAIDLALWDLEGIRTGRPVAALLSQDALRAVPVNAAISATDSAAAVEQARARVAGGFRCLKIKVGVGDDHRRVAAVREAVGDRVALRVDANGAWSVEEAIGMLGALRPLDLELCEEPVHGIADLQAVRAGLHESMALAMDETVADPGAIESGATDLVCLKIAACGGISGLIDAAGRARAAGSEVYLASTFDGPAGIAGALHAAAALRVTRPCGLAALGLFADCPDPFPVLGGTMAVPAAPGLGVGQKYTFRARQV